MSLDLKASTAVWIPLMDSGESTVTLPESSTIAPPQVLMNSAMLQVSPSYLAH